MATPRPSAERSQNLSGQYRLSTGCMKQFGVTSATAFRGPKLAIRDYLMAIAIFANAAQGTSALQLGRDLDVSYKPPSSDPTSAPS